jgi:IclR family mhp operon transcriptional activator
MTGSGKQNEGIRSISRALAVLQAINRSGSLRMTDICRQTELPYPTAYRIVQTLIQDGMVEVEPGRKRYRPTVLVRTLSFGYRAESELVTVARPHMIELCKRINWPVSLTTRVGRKMMVQESTHAMTSLTFTNYAPGYTLPLAECSTGKAYLAFCDQEERETVLAGYTKFSEDHDRLAQLLFADGLVLEDIRRKGYATHARNLYTDHPGKTSSLAAPVIVDKKVQGCVALIFFSTALSMKEAEQRYSQGLVATAGAIAGDLAAAAAEVRQ